MKLEKLIKKFIIFLVNYHSFSSKPSPINERLKTRKNIARPGNKAVHHIPVGKAESARFRSLPHSGISAGTPNPKKPKLPKTKTASAAFNVKRIGNGFRIFGKIYLKIIL